jgi:hypothetical protein
MEEASTDAPNGQHRPEMDEVYTSTKWSPRAPLSHRMSSCGAKVVGKSLESSVRGFLLAGGRLLHLILKDATKTYKWKEQVDRLCMTWYDDKDDEPIAKLTLLMANDDYPRETPAVELRLRVRDNRHGDGAIAYTLESPEAELKMSVHYFSQKQTRLAFESFLVMASSRNFGPREEQKKGRALIDAIMWRPLDQRGRGHDEMILRPRMEAETWLLSRNYLEAVNKQTRNALAVKHKEDPREQPFSWAAMAAAAESSSSSSQRAPR